MLEMTMSSDSLKGVPDFTTTTVEPETATIALPTSKPKIQFLFKT